MSPAGEVTAEAAQLLRSALPHGSDAIGKLVQRQARENPRSASDRLLRMMHGTPKPLVGERFAAFIAMVKLDVPAVANQTGLSTSEAAELMRCGLSSAGLDKKLPPAEKARMMFALYGIREMHAAQETLVAAMAAHPAFNALPIGDAWRMALDHRAWGDGKHQGLRFENEPGYMSGMFRGLAAMIQADSSGRRLDEHLLAELHDRATTGVFSMSTLTSELQGLLPDDLARIFALTGRAAVDQDPNDPALGNLDVLSQGFRHRTGSRFELVPRENLTETGLREMLETYVHYGPDAAFVLHAPGTFEEPVMAAHFSRQEPLTLISTDATRESIAAMAGEIMQRHSRHIAEADVGDAKLLAIARCCQELERSHLFEDGNARTVGFLALNKLLVENGLQPAMLEDPNRFDGHSAHELVREIKRGQDVFARYAA